MKKILFTFLLLIIFALSLSSIALVANAQDEENTEAYQLQIPIFDYAQSQNIAEYIAKIYQFIMIILVPLLIIVIIVSGIMWVSAAGDSGRIKNAKDRMTSGFIGLFIALFSYVILSLIGIDALNLPLLEKIEPESDIDLSTFGESFGLTPTEIGNLQSANPYQAICNLYKTGSYDVAVAACSARGSSVPTGITLIPLPEPYAVYKGVMGSESGVAAFIRSSDCVMAKFGKRITATGWRSAAGQVEIKAQKGRYAAKPCCSNHGSGSAFDVRWQGNEGKIQTWTESDQYLKDCFAANGLYAKIKGSINEPWHFSPSGY